MEPHGGRWRSIALVISGTLFVLTAFRLVGDYELYQEARAIRAARIAERDALLEQRTRAEETVRRLRDDPFTQEQLVRSMGYAKPGEIVYVITPQRNGTGGSR